MTAHVAGEPDASGRQACSRCGDELLVIRTADGFVQVTGPTPRAGFFDVGRAVITESAGDGSLRVVLSLWNAERAKALTGASECAPPLGAPVEPQKRVFERADG